MDAIYDAAGDEFKKAGKKDDIVALLETVRSKLGVAHESKRTKWNVNYHTSGTFITLIYETRFQRDKASEQFVFRVDGDDAKLIGYKIDSPLLVLK